MEDKNKITKDDIREDYPKIINCPLAIGEGWSSIVYYLCSFLQFHTDRNDRPQIKAVQIKEKFGGLRFYTESHYDFAHGAISFAESLSDKTCEYCGSMEDVGKTRGWITTICRSCVEDHDNITLDNWKPLKIFQDGTD